MTKYLIRSYLYIPEEEFTKELRKKLTFKNPDKLKYKYLYASVPNDMPDNLTLFRKVSDAPVYRVPRYALGNFDNLWAGGGRMEFKEDNEEIPIEINYTPPKDKLLNSSQVITTRQCIQYLECNRGMVLVAKPGEGKTMMAIWLICKLKQKTIILVHKDILVTQWRNALLELTDLKKEDIGLLKAGKFKDGKVVIGSQQSLMRTTISNDVNKLFSFKIQDEVHRIGATMFLRSYTRFNSRYTLGLSATPTREDDMHEIYYLHTSNLLYHHTNVRNVNASHLFFYYVSELPRKGYASYIPERTRVLWNLEEDNVRNNLLMKLLVISIRNGRKVLMVGEHIKHLKKFLHIVEKQFPDLNVVRFFGAQKLTKKEKQEGLVQEKYKDPDIKQLYEADIVIATYKKAMEGVDIPPLDTLIPLTPLSSEAGVEQVIGRIERVYTGKHHPLVLDIWDAVFTLAERMAGKRKRLYKQWGKTEYAGTEYDSIIPKNE